MRDVVDDPRMTDLTVLSDLKDAGTRSLQESLDELDLKMDTRRDRQS